MNVSQMRNIVVLKDLPSNIVDEAIIILKNQNHIKKKEMADSTFLPRKFEENGESDNELAVKEAEYIVHNYLKKLESSTMTKKRNNTLAIKYRKLQVVSVLITIMFVIGVIINIVR